MPSFVIGVDESRKFAQLSGDFNCQHLDEVQARRLPFGRTVVHGLHTLLSSLDIFAQTQESSFCLKKIRASFLGPVYQGDLVDLEIRHGGENITLNALSKGRSVSTINISVQRFVGNKKPRALNAVYQPSQAKLIGPLEIQHSSGSETLSVDDAIIATLFPALSNIFDIDQIAALLASTKIVGMECPGERSIFKYLSLSFSDEGQDKELAYRVERFEPVLSVASISLENDWIKGNVHAILRATPVSQSAYADIAQIVTANTLRGQHILVVGGTRGMGEVAAKIAAASGAEVTIGYALGQSDAVRVAEEINAGGGLANICKIDVLSKDFDIDSIKNPLSGIYYFASPKIVMNQSKTIDRNLLHNYTNFYTYGLEFVVNSIEESRKIISDFNIFMPSSVFIDEPDENRSNIKC